MMFRRGFRVAVRSLSRQSSTIQRTGPAQQHTTAAAWLFARRFTSAATTTVDGETADADIFAQEEVSSPTDFFNAASVDHHSETSLLAEGEEAEEEVNIWAGFEMPANGFERFVNGTYRHVEEVLATAEAKAIVEEDMDDGEITVRRLNQEHPLTDHENRYFTLYKVATVNEADRIFAEYNAGKDILSLDEVGTLVKGLTIVGYKPQYNELYNTRRMVQFAEQYVCHVPDHTENKRLAQILHSIGQRLAAGEKFKTTEGLVDVLVAVAQYRHAKQINNQRNSMHNKLLKIALNEFSVDQFTPAEQSKLAWAVTKLQNNTAATRTLATRLQNSHEKSLQAADVEHTANVFVLASHLNVLTDGYIKQMNVLHNVQHAQ